MNIDNVFLEQLLKEEIEFSNHLYDIYHYPDNITHLLYLIIPAFILKYGVKQKSLIEKCFSTVPILIDDQKDTVYQAFYFSQPQKIGEEILVRKGIVLRNYQNVSLMQLLDNLVHEFNHAMNSMKNEMSISDRITLRTGMVYHYYDRYTLSFIEKGKCEILEEVLNTKQTEMMIDIIKSFFTYSISNTTIQSTLYSIHHAIDTNYHSNSYFLESFVCRKLLENKTFLSTFENLRFEGEVSELYPFFDGIVGHEGALLELSHYLEQSLNLTRQLHKKWFKKNIMIKIQNTNLKAMKIVDTFYQNTVYK